MNREALDKKWYTLFLEHNQFGVVKILEGDAEQHAIQKKLFLNNDIENPKFTYPHISPVVLLKEMESLKALEKKILNTEKNQIVLKVYQERILYRLDTLQLLIAIEKKDSDLFLFFVERVFGMPTKKAYEETIDSLHRFLEDAEKNVKEDFFEIIAAAKKFLPQKSEMEKRFVITDEMREKVRHPILVECKNIFDFFTQHEEAQYKAAEITDILKIALDSFGLYDWKIVTRKKNSVSIFLDHTKKTIYIPEHIQKSKDELFAVIIHEIYSHILRHEHGASSPLQLLGFGIIDWYHAEEGIAVVREEALFPNICDLRRLLLHAGISFGIGMDGVKRNFREVYDFIFLFFSIEAGVQKKSIADAHIYAREKAWNTTVRIFRGTQNQEKGVVFTKDISYREGRLNIWEVVRDYPEEIARFNRGKYNPGNREHRKILNFLETV